MNAPDTRCGGPLGRDIIPKIELRGLKPFLFVDRHYNRMTYDISFLPLLFFYCRTHAFFSFHVSSYTKKFCNFIFLLVVYRVHVLR
jgi:hypothetical protein